MRQPGAIVFEKVSSRTTRPSISTARYEGTSESKKSKPDDFLLASCVVSAGFDVLPLAMLAALAD